MSQQIPERLGTLRFDEADRPIQRADLDDIADRDRQIRLIEPKGAQPFWDLLRHKVELLPS